MYYDVTAVTALENFTLSLTFKNGEEKLFDMKPYLEIGIFKELKDETIFKTGTG